MTSATEPAPEHPASSDARAQAPDGSTATGVTAGRTGATERTRATGNAGAAGNAGATERTGITGSTASTSAWAPVESRGAAARALDATARIVRRLAHRVTQWSAWVAEVTTAIGWACTAGAVIGLGVGYALGWREVLVIGWVLAVLVVVSSVFLIGRPRYRVELDVDAPRTTIGVPVNVRVRVTDESRFRLWITRLELAVGDRVVELAAPGPGGRTASVAVPAERRGVVTLGPVRTVRGDPVGLFRRYATWSDRRDVFVHPETVGLPSTSTGLIRDLEGSPTNELTTSDISFHALREYRPGDDRRHVSWKAVARTGTLMVRQFEQTRRSHIVVAFGTDTAGWADEDEFELGVSVVASLGARAIRDGRDLSVITTPAPTAEPGAAVLPVTLPTRTQTALLDGLSQVEWNSARLGMAELAELATTTIPGISIVFLVTGTQPSVRDVQSWSRRLPLGVETVVIVCGPGSQPGYQRLAELSVLRIGYLDDLRLALVRGSAS